MNFEIKNQIRKDTYLYSYLREDSYQYKYLYRNQNHIKEINNLAKEKYQLRNIDKLEKISNKFSLIKAFMSVIE